MKIDHASSDRRESFEQYSRLNRDSLYAQAWNLTRDTAEAEDLVQATLVRAWALYDRFDEEKPFRNWLGVIMKSTFLDRLRVAKRRLKWSSIDEMIHVDGERAIDIVADRRKTTDEAISERLLEKVLVDAILRLPAAQRKAIYLCDLLGYDYHECAEQEGVPLGTIRSRVSRARHRLRSWLWDWFEAGAPVTPKPSLLAPAQTGRRRRRTRRCARSERQAVRGR